MNDCTIGQFLSSLRKSKRYTQQNVADALNVSNKTVSGWERDVAMPDANFIPLIAELYGVSCDEILKGRKDTHTPYDTRADAVSSRLFLSTFGAQKTVNAVVWTIISCLFLAAGCITSLILAICGNRDNFALYYCLSLPFTAIALTITLIGYFTTEHTLRQYGKEFVQIRQKILNITRGALFAEVSFPFLLMPILFASESTVSNVLFSIGFTCLAVLPAVLVDNAVKYSNKDLFAREGSSKKNLIASSAVTAVAAVILAASLSLIYGCGYVGEQTLFWEANAEFDSYYNAVNALERDPLRENCISVSHVTSDDGTADFVYTFRKDTDTLELLAPYPEYSLYRTDTVDILYITFEVLTIRNPAANGKNVPSEESVVVTAPEYLNASYVKESDGKFTIVSPIDHALAGKRALARLDLAAAVATCAAGVVSLLIYLPIAAMVTKKAKQAKTP